MAVSIRLRREGNRNRPFYRIVVADSRSRRDGRFIEILGTYDPGQAGVNYRFDLARAERWLSHGAQPSDTVRSLIKKARRDGPVVEESAAADTPTPQASEPEPSPEVVETKSESAPETAQVEAAEASAVEAGQDQEKEEESKA